MTPFEIVAVVVAIAFLAPIAYMAAAFLIAATIDALNRKL